MPAAASSYRYDDKGASIKRLTTLYDGNNYVTMWQAIGNTSGYSQSIWEYITEDTDEQADNGDVIVHTGSTQGTLGRSNGGFGISKWSGTKSLAAYAIDGLSIQYYSNFQPHVDSDSSGSVDGE